MLYWQGTTRTTKLMLDLICHERTQAIRAHFFFGNQKNPPRIQNTTVSHFFSKTNIKKRKKITHMQNRHKKRCCRPLYQKKRLSLVSKRPLQPKAHVQGGRQDFGGSGAQPCLQTVQAQKKTSHWGETPQGVLKKKKEVAKWFYPKGSVWGCQSTFWWKLLFMFPFVTNPVCFSRPPAFGSFIGEPSVEANRMN